MSGLRKFIARGDATPHTPPPSSMKTARQLAAEKARIPVAPTILQPETLKSSTSLVQGPGYQSNTTVPRSSQQIPQNDQGYRYEREVGGDMFETDLEEDDDSTTLSHHAQVEQVQVATRTARGHLASSNDPLGDHTQTADISASNRSDELYRQREEAPSNGYERQYDDRRSTAEHGGESVSDQREDAQEGVDEEDNDGESEEDAESEADTQDGYKTVSFSLAEIQAAEAESPEDRARKMKTFMESQNLAHAFAPDMPVAHQRTQKLPTRAALFTSRNAAKDLDRLVPGYISAAQPLSRRHTSDTLQSPVPHKSLAQSVRGRTQTSEYKPLQKNHEALQVADAPEKAELNSERRRQTKPAHPNSQLHSLPEMNSHNNQNGIHKSSHFPTTHPERDTVPASPSSFGLSDVGEEVIISQPLDVCSSLEPPEVNSTQNAQDPTKGVIQQGHKRPIELDYDPDHLLHISFEDLAKESFDHKPRAPPQSLPSELSCASLHDRLDHIFSLKDDTAKDETRTTFFASLSIDEHEECGSMIVDQFIAVVGEFKNARRERRRIAKEFEREVAKREEQVRLKKDAVEKDLKRLRSAGEDVVRGKHT